MSISFNWKHLLSQSWHSIWRTKGTNQQLCRHRIMVLLAFWSILIPCQLLAHICLMLDNIFFPFWRKTKISHPVFIVGNFRSGTTFLQRHISSSTNQFSVCKTWEIYMAPSITQRKIIQLAQIADRKLGSPFMKMSKHFNKKQLIDKIKLHDVDLWKEEEDEGFMLYLWDSMFTLAFFPDGRRTRPYLFGDTVMSHRRRTARLKFYRKCITRHLYSYPNSLFHLSKNPALTPFLGSLKEVFPSARIIYIFRDPKKVLVSTNAWFSFAFHYFACPTEQYPLKNEIMEFVHHWYQYPLELFKEWDASEYCVVKYQNLVSNPVESIMQIFSHFNISTDDDFLHNLKNGLAKEKRFGSAGQLNLADIGYNEKQVDEAFAEVNERFSNY